MKQKLIIMVIAALLGLLIVQGAMAEPFTIEVKGIESTAQVGDWLTGAITVSGGTAPYSDIKVIVRVEYTDEEWAILYMEDVPVSNHSFTYQVPEYGNALLIMVIAVDSSGEEGYWDMFIAYPGVLPEGGYLDVVDNVYEGTYSFGETISFPVKLIGGFPPYQVHGAWWGADGHMFYTVAEGDVVSFTPQYAYESIFLIDLDVQDAKGNGNLFSMIGADSICYWHLADSEEAPHPPVPLTVQIEPKDKVIEGGQPLTFTWQAQGGEPPYRAEYIWSVVDIFGDDIESDTGVGKPDSQTIMIVPTKQGSGWFSLDIFDAKESYTSADVYFTVNSDAPSSPGDADGNGIVDINDLVCIIDHIIQDLQIINPDAANANGTGDIDIDDLIWIINKIIDG